MRYDMLRCVVCDGVRFVDVVLLRVDYDVIRYVVLRCV